MERCGPKPLQNRYQAVLYHHVKQSAVLWGLNYQQPIPFCDKEWMDMSTSAPLLDHETQIVNLGTKIPGILYLSNVSDTHNPASLECSQMLLTSRHDILNWINEFYQRRGVVIQECTSANFPAYFSSVKHNILEAAFTFYNFNDAWYLSSAWTYLYLVETTYLKIKSPTRWSQIQAHAEPTYASVQSIIESLCRTIPQALEPQSGFSGRLSINLFLRIITSHYEMQKREEMVRWCQNVESIMYSSEQGQADAWLPSPKRRSYLPPGRPGSSETIQ